MVADAGSDGAAGDASFDGASDVVDSSPIADARPLTPLSIFGMKVSFWYDGDYPPSIVVDQVEGGVGEWRDRSPNNRTIKAAFNIANDLTWLDAAVGGRGAIRFTGDRKDAAALVGPLILTGTTFIVIVVAAYSNPPGYPAALLVDNLLSSGGITFVGNSCSDSRVFGGSSLDGPDRFGCADSGIGIWSDSSGWNDGKPHVFSLRQDGATSVLHVRIDGTETSGVTPSVTWSEHLGGRPWQLEGQYGTEWSLGGYIAEVIGVDGTYGTPEEIAALDAYFKGKYGLPF